MKLEYMRLDSVAIDNSAVTEQLNIINCAIDRINTLLETKFWLVKDKNDYKVVTYDDLWHPTGDPDIWLNGGFYVVRCTHTEISKYAEHLAEQLADPLGRKLWLDAEKYLVNGWSNTVITFDGKLWIEEKHWKEADYKQYTQALKDAIAKIINKEYLATSGAADGAKATNGNVTIIKKDTKLKVQFCTSKSGTGGMHDWNSYTYEALLPTLKLLKELK